MEIKEMWERCKEHGKEGKDINSGGLGRLKVAGNTYVGGFFMNLLMLYSPETGGLVKANSHSPSYVAQDVTLSAEDYCKYLTK